MYMFMGSFEILFSLAIMIIIGIFIIIGIKSIGEWKSNNESPRLTVDAKVVTKRERVTHHSHANAGDMTGAHGYSNTISTTYYITFEVESGERMEFHVNGREYGLLAEGDMGTLSFQGTRYLGFERNIQ